MGAAADSLDRLDRLDQPGPITGTAGRRMADGMPGDGEPPQDGTDQHRSTGPQGCRAPMAADGRR